LSPSFQAFGKILPQTAKKRNKKPPAATDGRRAHFFIKLANDTATAKAIKTMLRI
jgi:hypothetical protein